MRFTYGLSLAAAALTTKFEWKQLESQISREERVSEAVQRFLVGFLNKIVITGWIR